MRLFEFLVKNDRHLPDDRKKTLLENVVKYNSQLRAVKDQDDQIHTQTCRELTCDHNYTLVLSASNNYDSQFNSMSNKTSRRVYNTEIGDKKIDQDSPFEVNENFYYNIDASATILLTNMTNR